MPFRRAAFGYVMADGSVSSTVTGAKLADVLAIRVTATAIDDGDDRFEFDVELRNRVRRPGKRATRPAEPPHVK